MPPDPDSKSDPAHERASALLDQLDQAHAAATPGPWENPRPFTKLIDAPGSSDNLAIVQADKAADAALIVAAVNHLPKLTAALRAVLDRSAREIEDAEVGARYAAEVNQSVLLASEETRAAAWRTAARILADALDGDRG